MGAHDPGGFSQVHPVPHQELRAGHPRPSAGDRGSTGWFSAELSKLPPVVEIVTTDVSAKLLKTETPKMFKLLKANSSKITRQPADYSKLPFPANHFDFVVCADALNRAVNVLRVLREIRRVLKPGGQFIAIREPVRPLMKFKSRPAPLPLHTATR